MNQTANPRPVRRLLRIGRVPVPGLRSGSTFNSLLLLSLLMAPTVAGLVQTFSEDSDGVLELGWSGVVRQTQPNTCGPAVLATLAGMRGEQYSEAEIVSRAELGPTGVTLKEFTRLSNELGLPGGWFRVSSRNLRGPLPAPSVLHLRDSDGHFVILTRDAGAFLEVVDPARGNLLVRRSWLNDNWTGRIFILGVALGSD